MAKVLGYWKLESSDENWDKYMKYVGINVFLRKIGNSISSYEDIRNNGDNWELDILSTFKNIYLKFKLGEEFDETTADGRKCKSTFVIEGNDLVHYQKAIKAGEKSSVFRRSRVDDDTMQITIETEDKAIKTIRIFKRQEK